MDAERFDTLARSLTRGGSRRHALTGLVAGALGLLGSRAEETAAHDLKATCKKKSGDAKKKCLKKAKQHAAEHASETPPCTPNCAGKQCGSDGCSGSCGTCTSGATCQGSQCVNGTRAVGVTCTQSLPGECASGVCGCAGATCTCRNATCSQSPPNGCLDTAECCRGFCSTPFCIG